MRTRKPNVTEKDFTMIKTLRAGGASTEEIVRLTGFSDSVIWNICKHDAFEDYVRMNVARRKGAAEKEKADFQKLAEQVTVGDLIQASDQEKYDLLIEMVSEIGSMVSEIGSTLARIADQLDTLTGGKKA